MYGLWTEIKTVLPNKQTYFYWKTVWDFLDDVSDLSVFAKGIIAKELNRCSDIRHFLLFCVWMFLWPVRLNLRKVIKGVASITVK